MESLNRFSFVCKKLVIPFIVYSSTKNNPQSKRFQKAIQNIRIAFQDLGTTYIKFGQMLSSRADIVGIELATELRKLLDQEPIIPFSVIETILARESKEPLTKIYKKIERAPIASASIAQVHKAVLLNGTYVAIKVQRPRIEEAIKKDIVVLKRLGFILDKVVKSKGITFSYICSEFIDWITNELDFTIEGRHADTLRENMETIEGITIPKVFWKYTTTKVLVMLYIEGHTLNEVLNKLQEQKATSLSQLSFDYRMNPDLLIKRIVAAVAKQALVDTFFHGDLHPANIIIQRKNTLAFVDFGIVGTLNKEEHMQLCLFMLALVNNDPESLEKVIVSLIASPLSVKDKVVLHQELTSELYRLSQDTNGKVGLSHLVMLLLSLSQKYAIIWSSGFLLAAKTIAQIDSVSQLIGIKQPLIEIMKPEVEKAILTSLPKEISTDTLYKSLFDLVHTGEKLPQTLLEFENIINSSNGEQLKNVIAKISEIHNNPSTV